MIEIHLSYLSFVSTAARLSLRQKSTWEKSSFSPKPLSSPLSFWFALCGRGFRRVATSGRSSQTHNPHTGAGSCGAANKPSNMWLQKLFHLSSSSCCCCLCGCRSLRERGGAGTHTSSFRASSAPTHSKPLTDDHSGLLFNTSASWTGTASSDGGWGVQQQQHHLQSAGCRENAKPLNVWNPAWVLVFCDHSAPTICFLQEVSITIHVSVSIALWTCRSCLCVWQRACMCGWEARNPASVWKLN